LHLISSGQRGAAFCKPCAGTLGVVVMKLALFLYCRGSPNHAVQAFALDHLNDVLVNGVGLAGWSLS
jgi:hypothetical protein